MDVDAITVKRSEPVRFQVSCSGHTTKSPHGNHVTDIQVDFDVEFPDSEGGRAPQTCWKLRFASLMIDSVP